jgi:hypothetical protein
MAMAALSAMTQKKINATLALCEKAVINRSRTARRGGSASVSFMV